MSTDTSAKSTGARIAGKFLTFVLSREDYGVEILKVHEIIGLLPITRVPRTPHYIRGVINLRGKVIPIMDLRLRFDMPEAECGEGTCIIVVQVRGVQMGLVVDGVSEVIDIVADDVEDVPAFGAGAHTEYLLGIAKSGGAVKLLLDIERVLTASELAAVAATA
jgi:purine-binding chemotaxis protein CheW